MTRQATARERRKWIARYQASGNAAETARHFGIARTTPLRWLARYDPDHPSVTLTRRKSPPRARPVPKEALFIGAVLKHNVQHPRWSARRIHAALLAVREDAPSEGAIGRWLRSIRRQCPICSERDSHNRWIHAQDDDFRRLELHGLMRVPRPRRKRPRNVSAVTVAEAIIRGAERRPPA
jgi:hypothetical protein